MSSVDVNPKDLIQFAKYLEEKCAEIQGKASQMRSRVDSMRGTWNDRKYQQFSKVFEENIQELERFTKKGGQYSDYLKRKARPIMDYLGRSLR